MKKYLSKEIEYLAILLLFSYQKYFKILSEKLPASPSQEMFSCFSSFCCRGLCHLRCEAKFAGQLKTLSHSGHRYST